MNKRTYDFSGWATKNGVLCSDGRVIQRDAFKDQDGTIVPLVWNHQHNDPSMVVGHALLENRPEGVYAYCFTNDTEKGRDAKVAVSHGDVTSLSIYANKLSENGRNVMHGMIREVSLVLAGANPEAYIDEIMQHSYVADDEAIFCTGEQLELYHDDTENEDQKEKVDKMEEVKKEEKVEKEETVQDVWDSLTDKQKKVVTALIGEAMLTAQEEKDNKEEDSNKMKHNAFDQNYAKNNSGVICHADQEMIIDAAKKAGSFRAVFEDYVAENYLQHDDEPAADPEPTPAPVSGFTSYPSGATPAGVDVLFPEWHDVRSGAPELVTNDNGWVTAILNKVHKSPFSRIRTSQVDIRDIQDLRAKGYEKGKEKSIVGNYSLVRRTTDPQTIYVKSALNRDDIIDITDFDYVQYQYKIDRMQLEEELATAMLLGDGRADGADGKIEDSHIRPVYGDDALYTIYKDLTGFLSDINGDYSDNFGDNYKYSEAMIAAMLDAKIDFKGTGSQDMFCTQQFFNKMMLAKDLNGRRIYANKGELATALGVANIYPVSKMAGKYRTVTSGNSSVRMDLDAIIINWADYSLGSTKGGQITHFTQFDIDFNQEKSLLETRVSGANTRIYSAIVIEEQHS